MATSGRAAALPLNRLLKHVRTWQEQSNRALAWFVQHLPTAPDDRLLGQHLSGLLIVHGHLRRALDVPTSQRPISLADLATVAADQPNETLLKDVAAHADSRALLRELQATVQDISEVLAADPPLVVRGWHAAVSVSDLVRLGTLSWVASLWALDPDLTGSTDPRSPLSRDAVADGIRALTQILAERHPGRSVEVRVPPFAAVQIGRAGDPGPTHTRGTPPNVVETGAQAFLRLALGADSFDDLQSSGSLQASGAHADISELFPLAQVDLSPAKVI